MSQSEQDKYSKFNALLDRHKAQIENMCTRRSRGEYNLFAELRQECYISIWKHQDSLRADANIMQETLWVYWQCRSVFSRLRFLKRANVWQPIDEGMADTLCEPEENGLREYIETLAVVLSDHEYRALQLMAEGYNPEEMAKELNIKHQSAIQLRYRIITKLKQEHNKGEKGLKGYKG